MDTAIAYEKVRRIIDEMNLDAILITDRYNMRYIASYRGEGVIVLAGFKIYGAGPARVRRI